MCQGEPASNREEQLIQADTLGKNFVLLEKYFPFPCCSHPPVLPVGPSASPAQMAPLRQRIQSVETVGRFVSNPYVTVTFVSGLLASGNSACTFLPELANRQNNIRPAADPLIRF